ncbi:hypothetical protein SO694_00017223 [Aureococcus anophagefferens]|uniref:Ig-like domain-containing protein n=1 Tax=Aureococcus anophagefferens TaxID=44056 RepID=A0ABR1G1W6_AURAN
MLGAPTMLLRPIILVAALARAVELDWIAQFSVEDKTFTAAGDVVFRWTGTHNVEKMASFDAWESCDFSGATLVGESSGATASGDDGETAYYACSVSSHCDWGQKVAVTFEAPPGVPSAAPTSAAPSGAPTTADPSGAPSTPPTTAGPSAGPSASPSSLARRPARAAVAAAPSAPPSSRAVRGADRGPDPGVPGADVDDLRHGEPRPLGGLRPPARRLVSNARARGARAAGSTSFYACSVGKHCTFGQKVAVDWTQPVPAPTARADRGDWYKKAQPWKDCPWVAALLPSRCEAKGDDDTYAWERVPRHLRLHGAARVFAPGAKTPEPSLWPTYGAVEVDSVDAEVTYRGNVNKKAAPFAEVEGAYLGSFFGVCVLLLVAVRLLGLHARRRNFVDREAPPPKRDSDPATPAKAVACAVGTRRRRQRTARPRRSVAQRLARDGSGSLGLPPPPEAAPLTPDDVFQLDMTIADDDDARRRGRARRLRPRALRAPDSPFDDDGPTASIRGSMTAFERHIAASSPKNKNLA